MTGLRTVGILGGMGPEATMALMDRVVVASGKDQVPLLVDMNTKVMSRIVSGHVTGQAAGQTAGQAAGTDCGSVLIDMAKGLQSSGAEALVMPCNIAHQYAQLIAAAVDIPLLDMVVLTSEAAIKVAGAGGTVGILGSPALQDSGIFDAAIAAAGGQAVYPDDPTALLDAIREIKSRGVTPYVRDKLVLASYNLLWQGAQVQLVGCTEFSLLERAMDPGAIKIDALDVLSQAIIAFSKGVSE